ncbi:MAG TPA: YrbL family protein [Rhodanobacteraceae bacterium]
MLALAQTNPLAIGHQRAVYQHPDHADLLIKTMRPESVAKRWNARGRWWKRLPRARQYSSFVRELKEYIAAHARTPHADPPIARVIGLVETDVGLGLVCEKVRGPDGALAPTLHEVYLREGGAPPWADAALETLLDGLLRHNVIVGDLNGANLAWGSDSRGGPRLIVIDGFGEKSLIPFSSMSRVFNRHFILRRYRRMRRRLATPVSSWSGPRHDP